MKYFLHMHTTLTCSWLHFEMNSSLHHLRGGAALPSCTRLPKKFKFKWTFASATPELRDVTKLPTRPDAFNAHEVFHHRSEIYTR